jgi:hydrogenase maturation protease
MEQKRILIACIGNIFFGDDAFGVEVAHTLVNRPVLEEVLVCDYGIHGLDLAFALLDEYEAVILVSTLRQGGQPGTVYLIEPDPADISASTDQPMMIESYSLNPMRILAFAQSMGARLNRILLIGCDVETPRTPEDCAVALSPLVQAAIPIAIEWIELLIPRILNQDFDASCFNLATTRLKSFPISDWKP